MQAVLAQNVPDKLHNKYVKPEESSKCNLVCSMNNIMGLFCTMKIVHLYIEYIRRIQSRFNFRSFR